MKIIFLGYDEQQTSLIGILRAKGHNVTHIDQPIDRMDNAELYVSFGYRHIIPEQVLMTAHRNPINLHMSLLPYNRGAHPLFWSVIDGTPSGVTIHEMDAGLDTGAIVAQAEIAILNDESLSRNYQHQFETLERLFLEKLEQIIGNDYEPTSHLGVGTYHSAKQLPEWLSDWQITPNKARQKFEATKGKRYDAIVVLANLMSADGILNHESRGRADLAGTLFSDGLCDVVVTTGWNYRPDSALRISDVFKEYLIQSFAIDEEKIVSLGHARDTVGDAVFMRARYPTLDPKGAIAIITSDYHAARTHEIFRFVFPDAEIVTLGATTPNGAASQAAEQASLIAFQETFENIKAGDLTAIIKRMCTRHPFYNGKIHPSVLPNQVVL